MPKTPTGDHWNVGPADSECRSKNEGNIISHPTGGMLIEYWTGKIPFLNFATVSHGKGKSNAFVFSQSIHTDRHGKSTGLRIRHIS